MIGALARSCAWGPTAYLQLVPLHMTKIAYGATRFEDIAGWFAERAGEELRLTTRYLPKRHVEMAGNPLYWILNHALVARSPILGFEQREDNGRWWIRLERKLIPIEPRARRAHQGWRYLKERRRPAGLWRGLDVRRHVAGKSDQGTGEAGLV